MSFLLAYVLVTVPGCSLDASQPTAPSVTAATVTVALDSATLLVGHVAQASATVKDTAGNPITGQAITWLSRTPDVATVSPSGAVLAVSSGRAIIEARVSGIADLDSLMVVAPPTPPTPPTSPIAPTLAFHDFSDGTLGPYGSTADVTFPDDPTGSGRGKVARMHYNPTQGSAQSSNDEGVAYNAGATHLRYGETIWMKGEFYIPFAGTAEKAGHHRKLIDYWGGGVRMTLYRAHAYNGELRLWLSTVDWMNGSSQETITQVTPITLSDDIWHTIEVKMVTNSADNVRDGLLEVYINGASSPSYRRDTGLGWITEKFPGGSYFNYYRVGQQLTIDAGHPLYTEYRYWDNVGFSTTRVGR